MNDISSSPIYCEHANEMPAVCPCPTSCYCYVHGNCKYRGASMRRSQGQPSEPTSDGVKQPQSLRVLRIIGFEGGPGLTMSYGTPALSDGESLINPTTGVVSPISDWSWLVAEGYITEIAGIATPWMRWPWDGIQPCMLLRVPVEPRIVTNTLLESESFRVRRLNPIGEVGYFLFTGSEWESVFHLTSRKLNDAGSSLQKAAGVLSPITDLGRIKKRWADADRERRNRPHNDEDDGG